MVLHSLQKKLVDVCDESGIPGWVKVNYLAFLLPSGLHVGFRFFVEFKIVARVVKRFLVNTFGFVEYLLV